MTFTWGGNIVIVQVLLGSVFLLAALVAALRPGLGVPPGLRGRWLLLHALLLYFLVAYFAFLYFRNKGMAAPLEALIGSILCVGGLFVLLVTLLLRESFLGLRAGERGLDQAHQALVDKNRQLEQEIEERKQVEQELLQYRSQLEEQVDSRTRELRAANELLLQETNKLEAVLAAIGDGLTLQDTDFRILYQNMPHRQKQGDHVSELCFKAYQRRDTVCPECQLARCFEDGQVHRREARAETPAGPLYMEVSASPLRDGRGKIIGGVEVIRDITDRKQLEEQLRQAQKMEAIGNLAGGIAHDFNNLLTMIIGYSELSLMDKPAEESVAKNLNVILNAGKRAAALTHQLLAFSRKQVLEMKVVDFNQVLNGMADMLVRLLGERIDLKLFTRADQAKILADVTQLEQVVMNLAINASDAMPGGGSLILETANVQLDNDYARNHQEVRPGDYVLLTVTDSGEGIPEEIRNKIFDPFFTTKGLGKGTGLGLSTVFGIVKQHKGHIALYSELGKGTAFKIYLPLAGTSEAKGDTAPAASMRGGQETILVVDDETAIRDLIVAALKPLGYRLLSAADGEEALAISRQVEGAIDLLLTDVIMRGMNGRELAEALEQQRPGIKVVYMSGYTDNVIAHQGVLKPGVILLNKPLTPSLLTSRIRKILDG